MGTKSKMPLLRLLAVLLALISVESTTTPSLQFCENDDDCALRAEWDDQNINTTCCLGYCQESCFDEGLEKLAETLFFTGMSMTIGMCTGIITSCIICIGGAVLFIYCLVKLFNGPSSRQAPVTLMPVEPHTGGNRIPAPVYKA